MNNKKSKQRIQIERVIGDILDNLSAITLLVCVIIVLVVSVIGSIFSDMIPQKFYYASLFFIGSLMVFILLEIRLNLIKNKKNFDDYKDMNEAQTHIFNKLFKRMKMKRNNPVLLRVYGMRLSSVCTLLRSFIHSTQDTTGTRNLNIYIYHCDPKFLTCIQSHDKKLQTRVEKMVKIQSEALEANIKELKRFAKDNPLITLKFKKYSSLPSFWAYEIDKEEVFWGYFTWDKKKENWVGPENQCFYFNKYSEPINDFTDWIYNQFDGLEDWSLPSYDVD